MVILDSRFAFGFVRIAQIAFPVNHNQK